MRFEKVSYEAFRKDMLKCKFTEEAIHEAYESIKLPERTTERSAGYDFFSPIKFCLKPGERMVIPTGIKVYFNETESKMWHLQLFVRSSLGVKQDIVLSNGTGIIDPDYYGNPSNEGDMLMALYNRGYNYRHFDVGDRIMQGVFMLHGLAEGDVATGQRCGGVGSTG